MNLSQTNGLAALRAPYPTVIEPEIVALSPAQQRAFDKLATLASVTPVVALTGLPGSGRSSILRALAKRFGGRVVTMEDILRWSQLRSAEVTDEAIQLGVEHLLAEYEIVLIDSFTATFHPNGRGTRGWPPNFNKMVTRHLYAHAARLGKRFLLCDRPIAKDGETAAALFGGAQIEIVELEDFLVEDYAAICTNILGVDRAAGIDFKTAHNYVAGLTGHQLRMACSLLASNDKPTTDDFISVLQENIVKSNIRVEQVEELRFESLPGTEHITSRLESQIVLPLQNRELARKLGLKPKRGVLLYGPPGTGKTSIGRALAHRMKGKFFMIDGTFVTEPPVAFFAKLRNVVREAKESAPSVLFIDDADVLFAIDHIAGLSRYMLTLLDGLESESAGHVCVMMTAMDVRKVPEALLRSGRVELWLETQPPSVEVRGRILQRWLGAELPSHETVDFSALAQATVGFTPADLRRVAGDAKSLYAVDKVKKRPLTSAGDYLQRAIEQLVSTRMRMAELLGDERLRGGLGRVA